MYQWLSSVEQEAVHAHKQRVFKDMTRVAPVTLAFDRSRTDAFCPITDTA